MELPNDHPPKKEVPLSAMVRPRPICDQQLDALPRLHPSHHLALLVSAILKKRTLCLSKLARAYPTSEQRRARARKHDLLHRLKRLWRCTDNARLDPAAVQSALVSFAVARLGHPR